MASLASGHIPLETKLINESGKWLSAVETASGKYAIHDQNARSAISSIIETVDNLVTGGVKYIGKTTSNITDGSTTNPITISGKTNPVTAVQGDLVIKDSGTGGTPSEFIWDGAKWSEFGAGSALKSFAFVDKGSVSLTCSGTSDAGGALTVDFSNATLGSLTWSGKPEFSGNSQNLISSVSYDDANLTVHFSSGSVTVPTGISTDAIKAAPPITGTSSIVEITNITGATDDFTRVSNYTTGSQTVVSSVAGASTTLSTTYTPAGGISVAANTFVTATTIGTLAPSGNISVDGLKPVATITQPNVNVTPLCATFFNSATVNSSGVLSFGSGNAITSVTAALASAPQYTWSGWSGKATFTSGGFTGALSVTKNAAFKDDSKIKFSGTQADIKTSGTANITASSGSMSFVATATKTSGALSITAAGSSADQFIKTVAYNGSGTKANAGISASGSVSLTGTETLTYKKAKGDTIAYKPSGVVNVSGKMAVAGSLGGTQTVAAHTHGVTVSGSSNDVTPYSGTGA